MAKQREVGRLEAAFIVVVKTVSLAQSFHEVVVVRRRVILILPVHRRFIDILILPEQAPHVD